MSNQLPESVQELWRRVDAGSVPFEDILLQRKRVLRRRRVMGIGSATAAILLIAAAGPLLNLRQAHDSNLLHTAKPAAPTYSPSSHKQLVGQHGIMAAVPKAWTIQQSPVCSTPPSPYVYFSSLQLVSCPNLPSVGRASPAVANLGIGTRRTAKIGLLSLPHRVVQNGLTIRTSQVECTTGWCTQVFYIPASNTTYSLRVSSWERPLLKRIEMSIAPVPDGFTTVPFLKSAISVSSAERALRRAHLTPKRAKSQGALIAVEGFRPAWGSVLRTETSVSLILSSR